MTNIDRVRRRLRQPEAEPPPPDADSEQHDDVVLVFKRPQLERFMTALVRMLDPHMPRPDSPALLAGAITTAIERAGGAGRPTVTRSPAGLYTPEYWRVRVVDADATAREALARLADGEEPAR